MTKIFNPTLPYCATIRGKIGKPGGAAAAALFGEAIFGAAQFGSDGLNPTNYGVAQFGAALFGGAPETAAPQSPYYGVYQMRSCKEGRIPIKMAFYPCVNPRTEPQQANRAKIRDAVAAWQALTAEDKAYYNKKSKPRRLCGYTYFIRQYLLSH